VKEGVCAGTPRKRAMWFAPKEPGSRSHALFAPGPSSGAVLAAARNVVRSMHEGQRCLLVFNDTARNYASTLLSNEWMSENNLFDDDLSHQIAVASLDQYRGVCRDPLPLFLFPCCPRHSSSPAHTLSSPTTTCMQASVEDLQLPAAVSILSDATVAGALEIM